MKTRITIAALATLALFGCTDIGNLAGPVGDAPGSHAPSTDCDDDGKPGLDDPCDPGTGGGGGTSTLRRDVANDWTSATCRNTSLGGGDSDGDGLNDQCEFDVAYAFSPTLKINPSDDVSRDEYYVVMPGGGNKIMILYAFGYHRDLGYTGGYSGHNGDSEFLVFELMPAFESGKPWKLLRAYLSAHRKATIDYSVTVTGGRMERDSEGRPLIWVAHRKHANYVSKSACGAGPINPDSCSGNTRTTWFWVYRNGNLGQINNRTYPSPPGCAVPSRTLNTSNKECYWNLGKFYGWQGPGGGSSTGYQDIFYAFGFNGTSAHIDG